MQGIASVCVSVLIVIELHQGVTASRPKIIPTPSWSVIAEDVFLIQEEDQLKIVCQGEGRIRVSEQNLPPYFKQSTSTGSFDEATGTYTFIRPRTVAKDTGWYACADESIEIKNDLQTIDHPSDNISWIYVYVNSSAPFAGMGSLFEAIAIVAGNDGVVPCRPTSPDLPVILEINQGDTAVPENTTYDPKIGFILKEVGNERNGDHLECKVNGTYAKDTAWPLYYVLVSAITAMVTPTINEDTLRHVVRGENMTLVCTITVDKRTTLNMNWTVPSSIPENRIVYTKKMIFVEQFGNKEIWMINVTIKDVEQSDGGEYTCTAKGVGNDKNTASKEIKIWDPNYIYVNMSVEGEKSISLPEGETAVWKVTIETYPEPFTFEWFKERDPIITSQDDPGVSKYSHTQTGIIHHLEISRLTMEDSGQYTIRASTAHNEESITLPLTVFGRPIVTIEDTLPFYAPGVTVNFKSRIVASPQPNVIWSYIEYPDFPSKLNSTPISLSNLHTEWTEETPFRFVSRVNVTINMTGDLICRSCNVVNCTEVTQQIFVSDVAGGFGIRDPGIVTEGDDVNLTCGASVYKYTDDVVWRPRDYVNENFQPDRIHVTKLKTKFTSQSILHIRNVSPSDLDVYTCEAVNNEGQHEIRSYLLPVAFASVPEFTYTSMNNSEIFIDLAKDKKGALTLDCRAFGRPPPEITWYKNLVLLRESRQYRFSRDDTRLRVEYFSNPDTDSGRYTCKARNRIGSVERYMDIRIIDPGTSLVELQRLVLVKQIKAAEAQEQAANSMKAVAESLERLTNQLSKCNLCVNFPRNDRYHSWKFHDRS